MSGPVRLFEPLAFRNLTIQNRVVRSSIAGRFDGFAGTGSRARIEFEARFARGGVGAIVSSWVGVDPRGRIVPGYASIDRDERIPFWRELGDRVHEHGVPYVIQLAHAGRQRDIPGFEFATGLSSTSDADPMHGFPAQAMTEAQIEEVPRSFAAAARRAREAGLDGVEIHGANGYLFTQFLSSGTNDRKDRWGGPLENRARLLLEVVRAVRAEVGTDYHLQVKISAVEHGNAFFPWESKGNTIADSVQVCRWLEEAGADAIHVSTGNSFPHPRNPAGRFVPREVALTYDSMISSGKHGLRNFLLFKIWPFSAIVAHRWTVPTDRVEGALLADSRAIREAVTIPVLCTGGFQTASVIDAALERGDCDAVTIARPLLANPDLLSEFAAGRDRPERPCTYCNRCLFNVLEYPIGCYDETRFDSQEEMLRRLFEPFDAAQQAWPATAPVSG